MRREEAGPLRGRGLRGRVLYKERCAEVGLFQEIRWPSGSRDGGGGAVSGGTMATGFGQLHSIQMIPSSLGLSFPFCRKGRLITILLTSHGGGSFLSTSGTKCTVLRLITE